MPFDLSQGCQYLLRSFLTIAQANGTTPCRNMRKPRQPGRKQEGGVATAIGKRGMENAIKALARIASAVCQPDAGTRKNRTDPALASSQGNETQAATKGDALKLVREKERVTDEEMQEQYEQVKYRFCFNTCFQAVAPVIVL